ncbi:potassium:proton antiporter [Rubrivivax sp. A210]|uniref:glutathione-regulated potassium-efflux system protein KefC n=1 Tax=Rubrivivax sp. A210 TaxID=2772301 RepID=UPI0019185514|nr:glutathione-regulated potassium-efflux system protein KefC [Rubrivivax sp. A210]CAD5372384.1 potassium:proton antiporter [Rubrivivax sp. A210]
MSTAAAHATPWLQSSLVYLGAAVLAVPLARLLGLGSIIGYLGAGIAIGPFGLALVTDAQAMLQFAEFGVVLMLFLVGLELEPRRLWALRRPIFGWGSVQLLGSAALIGAAALAAGLDGDLAVVAGLGLGMSSTAIGLGVLAERNLMSTQAGQSVLSVALLQDVAAIPILAIVPLLAAGGAAHAGGGWGGAAKAFGVIAAIVLGGRLLLRPALRWIARSGTPEIFTAASLLLVVATAALMQGVGLSMALGAFLAGVLLAESEYRHQLETDIEPFKGLLLGLFFIAVGMSIDFRAVLAHPAVVAATVAAFLAVKALVLWAMARAMPVPLAERPVFVILLAQGGEFGFVVFQAALGAGAISAAAASLLVAAVAISMLLTPLLLVASDRLLAPRLAVAGPKLDEITEAQEAPIIICGFGRYGQIVGRLINANGLSATVLDHNAEQVATVRLFGWPAFYGDATRLDLLRVAGAERARVIVVAIDDVEQSLKVVDLARAHFPQATLVARARNTTHWYGLTQRGVQHIERETLDAALMSGRSVLELMGFTPHAARTQALRFRRHTIELLARMAPHLGDQQKLIKVARQGREQLEAMWSRERAERQQRRTRRGEGFTAAPPSETHNAPPRENPNAPPREDA